jgi:hypothetical protein
MSNQPIKKQIKHEHYAEVVGPSDALLRWPANWRRSRVSVTSGIPRLQTCAESGLTRKVIGAEGGI